MAVDDGDRTSEVYAKAVVNPSDALESNFFYTIDLKAFAGQDVVLRFSSTNGAGGAAGAMIGYPRLYETENRTSLPNVLLVCSDTHRHDFSLGARGQALMPSFTKFASDSIVFDRAYANATWTIPSTAAVLTGLEPFHHGAGWRVEVNQKLLADAGAEGIKVPAKSAPKRNFNITKHNPVRLTVAEILDAMGYDTVCCSENTWLRFAETAEDGFGLTVTPTHLRDGGLGGRNTLTDLQTRLMGRSSKDSPLFMYLHSNHVHNYRRYEPLKSYKSGDKDPVPQGTFYDVYGERVREFDEQFNEVINLLKESGTYEDTLIVFYSDHGEVLKDCDGRFGHGKYMDESLLHVPLVIKPPNTVDWTPGIIDQAAQLTDIAPTIVDLVTASVRKGNFDAHDQFHGTSLSGALLRGEDIPNRLIHSGIQFYSDELASVRDGKWKYVYNISTKTGQLFDTSGQDCNPKDVSKSEQTVTKKLHVAFEEMWNTFIHQTLADDVSSLDELSTDQRESLEAMGYLE